MPTAASLRNSLVYLPVLCLPLATLGCVEEHGSTSGNSQTSADGGAGQTAGSTPDSGVGGSSSAGKSAAGSIQVIPVIGWRSQCIRHDTESIASIGQQR